MTQGDFQKFSTHMQAIAECFGQSLSAQGIALRFQLLAAYPLAEVEQASLALMTTRKYTTMPPPAEFLEFLTGGSLEDRAEVEAGKVLQAISQHGRYASVVFDDAVTQAVIVQAYGGWVKLCSDCGVEESEKWFRKEFVKIHAAYSRRGVEHFGSLAGLHEIYNSSNGFMGAIDGPKLVGDSIKALAVLEAGKDAAALAEGAPPVHGQGQVRSLTHVLQIATLGQYDVPSKLPMRQ